MCCCCCCCSPQSCIQQRAMQSLTALLARAGPAHAGTATRHGQPRFWLRLLAGCSSPRGPADHLRPVFRPRSFFSPCSLTPYVGPVSRCKLRLWSAAAATATAARGRRQSEAPFAKRDWRPRACLPDTLRARARLDPLLSNTAGPHASIVVVPDLSTASHGRGQIWRPRYRCPIIPPSSRCAALVGAVRPFVAMSFAA